MYSIDDFKALIDINPYRDFQVSNWLVEHLTGSFTCNTTNDKRIIIRKEIDNSVWGLTKIYSDLKNGLGFDPKHNISIARSRKCIRKKLSILFLLISIIFCFLQTHLLSLLLMKHTTYLY